MQKTFIHHAIHYSGVYTLYKTYTMCKILYNVHEPIHCLHGTIHCVVCAGTFSLPLQYSGVDTLCMDLYNM